MKTLKEFLKENEMLEEFVQNTMEKGETAEYINYLEPELKISGAFEWSKTKEGWETWSKLNKKWIIETSEEKIKFINELI